MDDQSPASAQTADEGAPSGPSQGVPASSASPAGISSGQGYPSAPRGPRRAGVGGTGARSAADRFGLDWATASPAVRAVVTEACARVPEEWEIEGPGVSLGLGDAADLDPDLLAAMLGPDGLGGQALGPQFGQDAAADALRPGPVLAALTEQAVADAAFLTDDQLTGALQAARRLETRAVAADDAGRGVRPPPGRPAQGRQGRGIPPGRRPGEFPDDELAAELLITRNQAAGRIEADLELTGRLPKTLAGMADGTISAARADTIAAATGFLSDADAARADEILAASAPGLRVDQLGRKAAALEMKLDPEAARIRKEHAKNTRQRVEVRRELSGNASIAGRELDTANALACKAYIDAVAVKLRNYGGLEESLSSIRARVMTELLQGRDPLALIPPATPSAAGSRRPAPRIRDGPDHRHPSTAPSIPTTPAAPATRTTPAPTTPTAPTAPATRDRPGGPAGTPTRRRTPATTTPTPDHDEPARRAPPPGMSAPLPASINLLVPVGTLLGWSAAPAHANGIGLLDPTETRDIVQAASRHPRTRWCATIINPDGTASAHACAHGQHPWTPHPRLPIRAPTPGSARPHQRHRRPAPAPRPAQARHPKPAPRQARLHDLLTAEARPRAHRPRPVRPPPRRTPLHPQPQAQAPPARPHPDLRRPRLQRPGRLLRPGPHHPLARRTHRPVQPRPQVQKAPPLQASARLERQATPTRRRPLDPPQRPRPHHHPHHLRPVTSPATAPAVRSAGGGR